MVSGIVHRVAEMMAVERVRDSFGCRYSLDCMLVHHIIPSIEGFPNNVPPWGRWGEGVDMAYLN